MNKNIQIKQLDNKDIIKFVFNKIRDMLRDLDQTTTSEKTKHLYTKVSEHLIKHYHMLTLNEIESTLDAGLNNGFGNFRKLTVQIIREWFDKRKVEMLRRKEAESNYKKLSRNETDILKSSNGGMIVRSIQKLRKLGYITPEYEKEYGVKQDNGYYSLFLHFNKLTENKQRSEIYEICKKDCELFKADPDDLEDFEVMEF